MTRDTVLGAGGLQSEWAVWTKIQTLSKDIVAQVEEPLHAPIVCKATEVSTLKARHELLERENELLRQRLAIADRQVDVKDAQINDFKAITENLTRQNQVLLMLAQGVPMERILKGGGHEIEIRYQRVSRKAEGVGRTRMAREVDTVREKVVSRLKELVREGLPQSLIAETLNKESLPTFSEIGQWDRQKVGKALRNIKKKML